MTGADFVMARNPEDIATEKRGTALRYCAELVNAASLIESDPEDVESYLGYRLLLEKEAARRGVHLVSEKDRFERKHLRLIERQYGQSAVDEIKAEAHLALCQPIYPLLGSLGSERLIQAPLTPLSWFSDPLQGYEQTRNALNLARKNWTNRRRRLPQSLDSLCESFIREDSYSGEASSVNWADVTSDTESVPTDETAHLYGMVDKLADFLDELDPQEREIAEILSAGSSVADAINETGASKREVQEMRTRLAEELAEYRPEPTTRKPYKKTKAPKVKKERSPLVLEGLRTDEFDEVVALFNAAPKKYGLRRARGSAK
jgi:hypothetical protein